MNLKMNRLQARISNFHVPFTAAKSIAQRVWAQIR
jgi:hypothetical protein